MPILPTDGAARVQYGCDRGAKEAQGGRKDEKAYRSVLMQHESSQTLSLPVIFPESALVRGLVAIWIPKARCHMRIGTLLAQTGFLPYYNSSCTKSTSTTCQSAPSSTSYCMLCQWMTALAVSRSSTSPTVITTLASTIHARRHDHV